MREWLNGLDDIQDSNIIYIDRKEKLSLDFLKKIQPRYIFFPFWSAIIPEEVYNNFECVIFHMTDVPFGRGGSPLQNLIARGIYETKMSALRCQKDLDAGPVYLKEPLSLQGAAEEIYLRASEIIKKMIREIITNEPAAVAQEGSPVFFARRKPHESNIANLKELNRVFDYIRMLDAEGYPKAYLETDSLHIEFSRAALKKDGIVADVKITAKKERNL